MLKPKKGFVQAQLNIERLTPIQWDGIMRAMDAYAEHYHEEQVKKLNLLAVIKSLPEYNEIIYHAKILSEEQFREYWDEVQGNVL